MAVSRPSGAGATLSHRTKTDLACDEAGGVSLGHRTQDIIHLCSLTSVSKRRGHPPTPSCTSLLPFKNRNSKQKVNCWAKEGRGSTVAAVKIHLVTHHRHKKNAICGNDISTGDRSHVPKSSMGCWPPALPARAPRACDLPSSGHLCKLFSLRLTRILFPCTFSG